ncbi:PAS domain S-box protein [Labilibaculum sp.]|uniref:PAS domain S-box protein n=1 Tax=Labilibaculum sp. TaxID=2060723 RepID=UPI0035625566
MSDSKHDMSPDEFERKLLKCRERIAQLESSLARIKKERDDFSMSITERGSMLSANLLFNSTSQGIIERNKEGRITYSNLAASNILGVDKEYLLNIESFEPRLHNLMPDGSLMTKERHPAKIALTTGKEVTNSVLGVYNPQKRTYIWISMTATPLLNPKTGKTEKVFTMFEDITEKLNFDKNIKEVQAKSKALLETIPDLILRISRTGKIIDFHGEEKPLFQDKVCILDVDIRKVFDAKLTKLFLHAMEKALDTGEIQIFNYQLRLQSRKVLYFEFRISSSGEREITAMVRDVSEQKSLQHKSEEVNRRLSTLMGNLTGMVYRCLADELWTMLYVSPGGFNVTGYSHEELNYNNSVAYVDLIHPDDRDYITKMVKEASDINQRFSVEYRIICKDGSLKWVYEQGITIKDDKNRDLFIEGYIIDITDRKLAEHKLIQSESKFRILFNSFNEAIFVYPWSKSGLQKFVEVNDTAIERYGYSREEFSELTPWDLSLMQENSEINLNKILESLHNTGSAYFETQNVSKSGRVFPVVINANLIEFNGEEFVQSIVRDVSYRKIAEAKLKHKTEIERLIIGISADFIRSSLKDVDRLINGALKSIGEFTKVDRSYVFLFDASGFANNTNEWCRDGVSSQMTDSKNIPIEQFKWWVKKFHQRKHIYLQAAQLSSPKIRNKLGNFHDDLKSILVLPVLSHDSLLGFVGFDSVFELKEWDLEDINLLYAFTDVLAGVISRRNFERQLIFAKEKAEESDQLKSTFLASMSHELRTPLNAIIGFSSLVKPDSSMEKVVKWNGIVQSSGKYLLRIIESIFDVSLLQAREAKVLKEEISLRELFLTLQQYVKSELKKSNKSNLTTRLRCSPNNENLSITTDKTKLIQLLTNLLNNAVKYTESGMITYGYEIEDSDIIFYVSDTGIGILPEHQEIIFEIFRQVEEAVYGVQSGVGLGLAICKEISHLLEGELWLTSEKDKGTNFFFKLKKVVHLPEKVSASKTEELIPPVLAGNTILVVEDIEFNYLLIEEILMPMQVRVIWAKNGLEAVHFVERNTKVDLILMDIKMPMMNGYKATEQILKMKPNIPIVAQTAYAMREDQKQIFASGCKGYISKPIHRAELYKLISQFLKPKAIPKKE